MYFLHNAPFAHFKIVFKNNILLKGWEIEKYWKLLLDVYSFCYVVPEQII